MQLRYSLPAWFFLALLAPHAGAQRSSPFSCGPFLLAPGDQSMTVVVDHEKPKPATLRYWKRGLRARHKVEHRKPLRHHLFRLEGLTPGTAYQYEIVSGRKSTGTYEFRTLPSKPDHYRLVAFGDVRSQPKVWHAISELMRTNEPDALFMIGTGDYPVNGRDYKLWVEQFFEPGRELLATMPFWPAIGNHEGTRLRPQEAGKEASLPYFSLFELPGNERWYRVDYQFLTLLVLDSNSDMDCKSPQYRWLLEQLIGKRERHTIVVFHHAPFTSGPHGRRNAQGTPVEWPIAHARLFLVPMFELYGVNLVLNGHDHLYERSEKDGITYVVTGGGGAPLYRANSCPNPYQKKVLSAHHYIRLDVDAKKIVLTAIDSDGKPFDTVTIPAARSPIGGRR